MVKLLAAIAALFMTVNALQQREKESGSYYEFGDHLEQILGGEQEMSPEMQELYYVYYYYDGPSVAFIIFVDILIPIVCCVAIVVTIICVVKAIRRKRLRELEAIE